MICPPTEAADLAGEGGVDEVLAEQVRADVLRYRAFRCKTSLAEYVRQSWHVLEPATKLEWNWHHELICYALQEMFFDWQKAKADPTFKQRARNTIFNQPPGSLKSRIVSVCFPTWAWLHDPAWRVICLSVTNDAVKRDARYSRQLIESPWYQEHFRPEWSLKEDQDAVSDYGNTAGGFRLSKPSGSEIVGLRGDALLLDDPNNPHASHSEKARKQVNGLWNTNTFNRVNSMVISLRIIVQQRTHELDLTGYVLDQAKKPGGIAWCHVCLPGEFDPKRRCVTPFGADPRTRAGESIHPQLWPPEVLASEAVRLGPYDYAGQVNQSPAPADGGIFKRAWFSGSVDPTALPTMTEVVISLDANAKKTASGSRAALLTVGAAGPRRYVLGAAAAREELPWICEQFRILHREATALGCRPTKMIVEMRALGYAFVQTMREEIQALNLELVEVEPGDDKVSRAKAQVPICAAGNVVMLKGAPWAEEVVHEVCVFPNGATDDYVDSLAQALAHLSSGDSNSQYLDRRGGIWDYQ